MTIKTINFSVVPLLHFLKEALNILALLIAVLFIFGTSPSADGEESILETSAFK